MYLRLFLTSVAVRSLSTASLPLTARILAFKKAETDFVRFMLHYQCISVVTKIMFDKELLISVSILAEAQITTVVDVSD